MTVEACHAVVVAAGVGRRMQAATPKQYLRVAGRSVLEHAVAPLLEHAGVASVVIVLAEGDSHFHELPIAANPRVRTTVGGSTRSASVIAGLDLLSAQAETCWILVHDGARPCLPAADVDRLLAGTDRQGALLAVPVRDTLKRADARADDGADDGAEGRPRGGHLRVATTVAREHLWQALTPQVFPRGALHAAMIAHGHEATDEAQAMECAGFAPALIEGDASNIKVTHPGDLPLVASILHGRQERPDPWAVES